MGDAHVRQTIVCGVLYCLVGLTFQARTGPCEVDGGQSSIILDIEESRGSQVSQHTIPEELPVLGSTEENEIRLRLQFPKAPDLFFLEGKKLKLLRPLDRDQDNLSHVVFHLTCEVVETGKKRTIPVIVRVSDINDNAPVFQNTPYEVTVPELTPIGTTIFQDLKATDADAGVNGLAEYFIVPWNNSKVGNQTEDGTADGYSYFSINLPHQGQVTVNRSLDYEKTKRYLVTIVASDRARNLSERFSSTTTLTVNIKDEDDQDPSFIYQGCMLHDGACINPEYTASVMSGVLSGVLDVRPEKIQAVDMDTLNYPINYSFLSGTPDLWEEYFRIDKGTGSVQQVKPVDTTVAKKFELVVKAEEVSELKRFATAKLSIMVKPIDANPPVITASSTDGHVLENSPIGTKVTDADGKPIQLTVSDIDLGSEDPKPSYTFELTTNSFEIDKHGYVIVNEENLDRDPPNPGNFRFQIVAREAGGSGASAPLTLKVKLDDVNDNSPILPVLPPINVPALDEPQIITKVAATDSDEGENGHVRYSIYHVSNNGATKFAIDPETGILESTGRLVSGEQYSVTILATDGGGRSSQTILELKVSRGPNRRPPVFMKPLHDLQVSEGVTVNSTLATITAFDPENDPVTYSIISGNDLRQFAIGANTGVIYVIRKLDREDLTRYQLLIKAEDPGKLSSTATVNIRVTDINDNNPKFDNDIYNFTVKEGAVGANVGRVHATDADEGINALVTYSIPSSLPFSINNATGDITTSRALDYETKNEYKFVVTAMDGAVDARLGTASVMVKVIDVPDEVPIFYKRLYTASVPENSPDFIVTQVEATDPDTVKDITYIIKQGDTDLFSIERKTGIIRTQRALDREREAQHVLIVGTEENDSLVDNSTTRVVVNVEDRNDNSPVFTSVPRPVTLDDEAEIGTVVMTLLATDADATSPNNKVRYQLLGRGKATKFFQLDAETGVLRLRDDLKKDTDSEYQLDVKAYDLGEPQLSSVSSLNVFVRHIATVPPEAGLGWAEIHHWTEVAEDAPVGQEIRRLSLLNVAHLKAQHQLPVRCQLNDHKDLFYVKMTDDLDCALYLNSTKLDYEKETDYNLDITLDSLEGLINEDRKVAHVKVIVVDVNDNIPTFIFPERNEIDSVGEKYFAIVTEETVLDSNVIQVQAKDKDSGNFGKIEYQKNGWDKSIEEYFSLDSETGIIRNIKTFENVSHEILPFRLNIVARDNPGSDDNYNIARAPIIINLLKKSDELVLSFVDSTPTVISRRSRAALKVLSLKTGLLVFGEKYTTRMAPQPAKEGEPQVNQPSGTNMWFYVIDPRTDAILSRDSDIVRERVLCGECGASLAVAVGTAVRGTVLPPSAPLVPAPERTSPPSSAPANPPVAAAAALPAALLALAAAVLLLGLAAIIYITVSWNKYKKHKQQMVRQYGISPVLAVGAGGGDSGASTVRYEPVSRNSGSIPETRYETQVLAMAVPPDDADLQIDFGPNSHAFNLDSVSYITKENGQQSPISAATTVRASSIVGCGKLGSSPIPPSVPSLASSGPATLPRVLNNATSVKTGGLLAATLNRKNNKTGGRRPGETIMAYDEIPGMGYSSNGDLANSPSNENVTFGKRDYSQLGFSYLNDRSPVETTTEL